MSSDTFTIDDSTENDSTEEEFNFDAVGINETTTGEDSQYIDDDVGYLDDSTEYDHQNRLGQTLEATDDSVQPYSFGLSGIHVLGMPLYFNPISDPFNRVFEKTFENDLPLVYITPGKPKINKKMVSTSGETIDANTVLGGLIDPLSFGIKRIMNFNDLRYIRFERDYKDYYKYVQTMLMYLYKMMGFEDTFKFEDFFQESDKIEGLCYFCEKSTSISQSGNNSYGSSSLASNVNSIAGQTREYRQYLGMQQDGEGGILSGIMSGITDILQNAVQGLPVVGKLLGAFGTALSGSQLYYPDIWQDGKYSRNYNLNFKFFSPYGDARSIFRYVYVPFISLLAMAIPLQDGMYAYKQPFLTRIHSPGYFECECGAITNIDFKFGGSDSLWTSSNFPNEIEVSVSVQDLYPTMLATNSVNNMKYNIGLSSFLESMSGLSFNQLNTLDRIDLSMELRSNAIKEALTLSGLRHWGEDRWSDINTNVSRIFS